MDDLNFLKKCCEQVGCALDENKLYALIAYRDEVCAANARFNLTAITTAEDFAIKHIADSLIGADIPKQGARLCDIGSGAGFPAFPLAVAREDLQVVAMDSTAKKMNFVQDAAKKAGVKNISVKVGRAEEWREAFESFDVVTARAVASLSVLLELAVPLLKVGGIFIAYKTDESELAGAKGAMAALGVKLRRVKLATLDNGEHRALLIFEKTTKTNPVYPRKFGVIKKKPL